MSLAQQITSHYGGTWHGHYGCIPTEGHSAKDRGTSLRDAADAPDGLLVHCHNGGDALAEKARFRRDGLLPPFEPQRRSENDNADAWRCTGTYDFRDEAGTLLYRTRRHEHRAKPKRFTAERPDGAGGWTTSMGDVRRVLYRLPELLAADPAEPVYLTEGERKADKLVSWGFTATAFAFGAKSWRKEYAQALSARTVIILPDNDANGQDMARRASDDITTAGGAAHIVELPGLPPKGDIIDWAGTAAELRELTAKMLMGEPDELLPFADLSSWALRQPKPKPFDLPGCAPKGEVTLLTSSGGGMKSTFGHQFCVCHVTGKKFLGLDLQPGKAAIYNTAEDDFDRLEWMHAHICRALGVEHSDLFGKLGLSSVRGCLNNELATFDAQGRIRPTPAFARLRASVAKTGASLLVLDNVGHMFAGNENDRVQVTAFVNLLYSLCRDFGVTILLIAHPNKSGDSYSGSTAWPNAVRSHLVIDRPEGSINTHDRILRVEKANYAKPGEELRFVWHDFALWCEEDLSADTRAEMDAVIRANGENAILLRCLAAATQARRAVSHHPGVNYYATVFAAMPEAKGLKRKAFEASFERLLHMGAIELDRQLWQRENRSWKYGIKAAEACTDPHAKTAENTEPTPAPTPCTDPHQPAAQVIENTAPTPHAPTPHSTTYYSGAAHEAAAPRPEDDAPDDFLRGWDSRAERGA
jgi:RecA-family ATPase